MKKLLVISTLSASLLALVGCGGGSGSSSNNSSASSTQTTTVSGQAVVGSPMAYAQITFKSLADKSLGSLVADAEGRFALPSSVTYPVIVRALSADGVYENYGYVASKDQQLLAVNPLTTMALAIASGKAPSAIEQPLSQANLERGNLSVRALFKQLFGQSGVVGTPNLYETVFDTNHTSLDLVLDAMSIDFSADGVVHLVDKLTGSSASYSILDITPSITPIGFSAQKLEELNSVPLTACSKLLNSMDGYRLATDASVYDPNFKHAGRDVAEHMRTIASITQSNQFIYKMPVFKRIDANGNYVFSVLQVNSADKNDYATNSVVVKKSGADCKLVGDQFPVSITVRPAIKYLARVDGTAYYTTSSPLYGYEITLGGQNTPSKINGESISGARVEFCSSQDQCVELASLSRSPASNTYVDNAAAFDLVGRHRVLGLIPNPDISYASNLANPVRVTFYTQSNAVSVFTTLGGKQFTASEVAALKLPKITNPEILNSVTQNPLVNYDSADGVLFSIMMGSANRTPKNVNQTNIVLDKGAGSTLFNGFDMDANAHMRSLTATSVIPNRSGGVMTARYVWAPSCDQCR